MEETFYDAACSGKVEEVKRILRKNPSLNVNWKNEKNYDITALFAACNQGHDSVVSILLAHPNIDPNLKRKFGWTPFITACYYGRTSCVRLLLKDQRVKVNVSDMYGRTPLYHAAHHGFLDIIKLWIASGREMYLGKPTEIYKTDAIGAAKREGKPAVATLLERFKSDAAETRHAVRVEIGWYDELAAEMFAIVVFVSDGLLQVKDTTPPSPAARYFGIARRLPLELQMMLCHRVVGSTKEIIPGKDSEVAFKELAKRLWSSIFSG